MNNSDTISMKTDKITINNFLSVTGIDIQRQELIKGLTSSSKTISSKYFYDKKGSELFEEITKLKEYYPTRTELGILQANTKILTKNLTDANIIELGSGDCSKISVILNSMSVNQQETINYIPVDVSLSAIEKSAMNLIEKFPSLKIHAIAADFMHHPNFIPNVSNKFICFFGSTIGNLNQDQASDFIKNIGNLMNPDDLFLLGIDMVKDSQILENAYNDSLQITAAFNKNILNNVNTILETDFDPDLFEHNAFYNKEKSRIEMHLKALEDMQINSPFMLNKIHIKKNESIHTENSHKFTKENIYEFAKQGNLNIKKIFSDEHQLFSLVQFIK